MNSRGCDLCGKVVRGTSATPRCRPCRKANPAPRTVVKNPDGVRWVCEWCGVESFREATRGQLPKYCGKVCQGRAGLARRAERRGEFTVHRARRLRLYERDGWVCQICGVETSRVWSADNPWSPTLDHIIPRSETVNDGDDNLRTAHAFCNALRSNDRFTDAEVRIAAEAKRG